MGATFSRVKTWIAEKLNYADLNAEIDNILDNFDTDGVDDYSVNATEMQTVTDPGALATESLATSLSGELERLRYVIKRILGAAHWYTDPGLSMSSINSALNSIESLDDRLVSGNSSSTSAQSLLITPVGASGGDSFTVNATATDLVYVLSDVEYTVTSDIAQASSAAPPITNNTATISDANLADQSWTKYHGMYGGGIALTSIGSEIASLDSTRATFRLTTGASSEYISAVVDNNASELIEVNRGYFFDSAGAGFPAIVFSDADTITLMNTTHIFINVGGTLAFTVTEPVHADTEPGSPASGDYWFDISLKTWKVYDGATYNTVSEVYVGMAITDENDDCIAARSADFYKPRTPDNDLALAYNRGGGSVIEPEASSRIGVYGSYISTGPALESEGIRWPQSVLDTGAIASDTLYFYYLTEAGVPKISLQAPLDMRSTRGGIYHPHETWRAVGQAWFFSSNNPGRLISYNDDHDGNADALTTVAASALTAHYFCSPLLKHRFPTEDEGNTTTAMRSRFITVPYHNSLVIPSGATMDWQSTLQDQLVMLQGRVTGKSTVAPLLCADQRGLYSSAINVVAMTAASDNQEVFGLVASATYEAVTVAWGAGDQTTAGTWASVMDFFVAGVDLKVPRKHMSAACGDNTVAGTATATESDVTNLSDTIHTEGRPIMITFQDADLAGAYANLGSLIGVADSGGATSIAQFRIYRDAVEITRQALRLPPTGVATSFLEVPAGCLNYIDFPPLGSYTYKLAVIIASGGASQTIEVSDVRMCLVRL